MLEATTRLLEPIRQTLGAVVSPLRYVAELPYLLSDEVEDLLLTQDDLRTTNAELTRQVLEMSQISQRFLALRKENERLRELMGSRRQVPHEVLVAELIGVAPRPSLLQVTIDKGSAAGAFVGQAVLDSQGLFGQIIHTDRFTSQVLMISDSLHAVPVEINRTGLRGIVAGTGEMLRLQLEDIPTTADIREGDLLVSSGLGERFPRGYPVGRVSTVLVEPAAALATVVVTPAAALDRSRHVLLVFPARADDDEAAAAEDSPAADPQPPAGAVDPSASEPPLPVASEVES